jgi:hypothetical protein
MIYEIMNKSVFLISQGLILFIWYSTEVVRKLTVCLMSKTCNKWWDTHKVSLQVTNFFLVYRRSLLKI